jgi:hypothetical protein
MQSKNFHGIVTRKKVMRRNHCPKAYEPLKQENPLHPKGVEAQRFENKRPSSASQRLGDKDGNFSQLFTTRLAR